MAKPTPFFWWDLWLESWATGMRLAETMIAVPTVVNARLPMIHTALRDPLSGDYRELYKMVAEKTGAFALASLSLARDAQAIQAEMMHPARSAGAAAEAGARIGRHVTGALGRALAPVHAEATGNARRLGRRGS